MTEQLAEDLAMQVAELQALSFAYDLQLTAPERAALQHAADACGTAMVTDTMVHGMHGGSQLALASDNDSSMGHSGAHFGELSGIVCVPDVRLGGAPVRLRFHLPLGYPSTSPASLTIVDCAGDSATHQALTRCMAGVAARELGACCLLTAVQEAKDCAEQLLQASATSAPPETTAAAEPASSTPRLARQLIWFHHIKSLAKRKAIVEAAVELRLGGACKPGFPGVVVVEGAACDVADFTSRIKALGWQAMQVRAYEDEEVAGLDALNAARKWLPPLAFCELPETGMSELGQRCKRAGLDALFAAALKL